MADKLTTQKRLVAYFSMEIALENAMPSYSGGLGVLAGDTIRAAADLKLPMVAISLLYRKGFFTQILSEDGVQTEEPAEWRVEDFLKEEPARVSVPLENRRVELRCWRYDAVGARGHIVPIYFLDADLPSNEERDRNLTGSLYGGDSYYRLCQEVLLGIGGVRMLRALGYEDISRYHMNEGHAALLTLELLGEEAEKAGRESVIGEDIEKVRRKCVFTTHTPVPAGHDRFPMEFLTRAFPEQTGFFNLKDASSAELLKRVLQAESNFPDLHDAARRGASVNMTQLALGLSNFVNGVAKKHGEVSRRMFPEFLIEAITNGVHAATWAAPAFQQLFDRYIPSWREDNYSLRSALGLPVEEVWAAHLISKHELFETVRLKTGLKLDPEVFTIGFARRATSYKRADLILSDLDRLREIVKNAGKFQIVFAGKAHPNDGSGKEIIKKIFKAKKALKKNVQIVFLDNYNMELGGKITAGVDLWLNTPQFPLEASGTSGMKAALNGVPSLSILDGWWVEGHIEGVTGWSIGELHRGTDVSTDNAGEAESLYHKLGDVILPLYYNDRQKFLEVMLHAIAINGSFFNTQRMVQQYVTDAYLR
ncbi:MAG: alpha-glucan family phosphorylase [Acidobacteria bacterium]|nr:alpha-glucan family phosphorylase [Acidobacteriota bacterium]MBS1864829.1 alpha-glucan family phosphorylase [Acidobacteriota bacterium]